MAYSFEGSLQEFIGVLRQGENVGQILSTSRLDTGGHKLGSLEEKVWRSDAVVLLELFTEYGFPIHKDCYVLAEYDIPGHLGRCDIVILGNDRSGKGHGVIVELKSWSSFESIPGSDFINVAGRTTLHPSSQVQQYVDCTRSFHSRGGDYEWHGMVWMTKMTPQNARRLISNRYAGIPIVSIANAEGLLRQNLADWLSQPIDDASKKAFLDAKPVMRARLAKDLFDRLPNITRGVAEAVEHRPIDLTTRQAEIVHSALHEAEISGRKLVLVSGEPGSGKTVVGLNIMIQQLVRSQANAKGLLADTVVMGLRNNRLCTVLRSAIDDAVGKKVGKALVKYIKPGGPLGGLIHEVPSARDDLRALNPKYKVIVIDEAHRVPRDNQNNPRKTSQLDAVLALGETVVCLVDEGQCLNRDDNGTAENIVAVWHDLYPDAPVIDLRLSEQHRIPPNYAEWLDAFLGGKQSRFPSDYDLRVVDTPEEVVEYLREKTRSGSLEAGLLASFTICNGRKGNDVRVPKLGILWLMEANDYDRWWRDSRWRHEFNRCSSVYGCQGFELDYAGLFWGRDLALSMDGGQPEHSLAKPHDVEDDIGMAYGAKFKTLARDASLSDNKALRQEVLEMLRNRYRILLSRARMGLVIHCEDPQTRDALRKATQVGQVTD